MVKKAVLGVFLFIMLYTRFIGLSWGLPYPMHPDERNMAVAVLELKCESLTDLSSCMNPHFFAYGQTPLYLAYGGISLFHAVLGAPAGISFEEATVALRVISALASLATAFVLFKLIKLFTGPLPGEKHHQRLVKKYGAALAVAAFIFSPYGVQFSHFGTTESLLMLLYTSIVYLSLRAAEEIENKRTVLLLALCLGLGIGIKVSSVIFLAVPFLVFFIIFLQHKNRRSHTVQSGITMLAGTAIAAVVCSPQTIISWKEFMGSFSYESAVATGMYRAFYTRQFVDTIPVLFQFEKVFPFALGFLPFALAILGFLLLSWKDRRLNILRLAIVVYLLPTSFLFAKWSRFMAPVLPLMTVFGALFVLWLLNRTKKWMQTGVLLVFGISLLPGIAYISVYANPDVRFTASTWIYSHVPPKSKILSETANVIDIPVPPPEYKKAPPSLGYVSFDFYHLDEDPSLQAQLHQYIQAADYIFVPSRRVFMDHPASSFPQLGMYYDALFAGKLGYTKIKEFTSYPRISVFGHTLIEFPDEGAEETWTVFDHPVIRIYKRTTLSTLPDFSGYKKTTLTVEGKPYRLLVADSPQKWEQGLMWVRSKEDTGGYDGMLFVFPAKTVQSFWNKNTVSGLDLYWLDGQSVVGKDILPSIEESKQIVTVTSPKEADKVVEIIR